jgi:hypothetical protein
MNGTARLRPTCLMAALALLSACGTDGPPRAPEPAPAQGITMSGEVQMGVVVVNPRFVER